MELHIEDYFENEERTLSYPAARQEIQDYLSREYSHSLADSVRDGSEESTGAVLRIIGKYLDDRRITVDGMPDRIGLLERLYNDLARFGLITGPVDSPGTEEVNCNSWEDLEVLDGCGCRKLAGTYESPGQFRDVVKKVMRIGSVIVDEANPIGDGYIRTGVRASAITTPCVDPEVGAALFIRRQSMNSITREDYINQGAALPEELDLIATLIRCGVSTVFAGAVGSGKTTDMNYFLRLVPPDRGLFVIEDTRELDLIRRDDTGKVISRVLHTKTRPSDDPAKNIGMDKLLKVGLRSNMQYIIPSEMRGAEAMTAQEAARTGQTVVTSLHARSARGAYRRILTMCQMQDTRISDHLLLEMIAEAFPIVIHKKKLPDGSRRIMEIFEATGTHDGRVEGQTLYRFSIEDNVTGPDGKLHIVGHHEKVNPLSDTLAQTLLDNGASRELVRHLGGKEVKHGT